MFRTILISVLFVGVFALPLGAHADVVVMSTTTATTTPPTATTTPTTTPPVKPPKPTKPSGPSFFQQLLQSIASMFQAHTTTSTSGGVTTVTTSVTVVTQKPFGGAILSPVITCTAPPGAKFVQVLSGPKPIPIICQPGVCTSYLNGPPAFVGQWLLGNATPVMADCYVGTTLVGRGYVIGSTPGHGSSGAPQKLPEPTKSPGTPSQCGSLPGGGTPAQDRVAEANVRTQLAVCSNGKIDVTGSATKDPCSFGTDTNGVKAGCTNVYGLQCANVDNLCNLSQQCGDITVIGGNEGGHRSHNAGWATDLVPTSSLSSCIQKNFTPLPDRVWCSQTAPDGSCIGTEYHFKRYMDSYGNTYMFETTAPGFSTGNNIHVCVKGKAC